MSSPALTGCSLREALGRGPLTADGAMGTELHALGVSFDVAFDELSVSRPDLVAGIHERYVRAGARVIETNSFGANRVRLGRHGLGDRVRAVNLAAARVARAVVDAPRPEAGEARRDRVWVAGAIGPTGMLSGGAAEARAILRDVFREQAAALAEGGVDAILIETMGWSSEIEAALTGARLAVGDALPILAHVSVGGDLALADGTSIAAMGERLRSLGCEALGVNCCDGAVAVRAAEALLPLGLPVSVIPSAGLPQRIDGRFVYGAAPADFGALAHRLRGLGVAVVGGCCGTTPEHVAAIAEALQAEPRPWAAGAAVA